MQCNGAAQYPIRAPASFALRYTMCMCIARVQCAIVQYTMCNAVHWCSTITNPSFNMPESSCTKCNSTHSIIRACKLAASKLKSIGFRQRSKMPASPKLLNKAPQKLTKSRTPSGTVAIGRILSKLTLLQEC